ncbi:helix-turn-helix domain-containing protein [Ruegeria conchae]|uniref:helix-turn-helix domain-containing protein n=1 Tax=Ruegeria conchae TaxID=981384 RepID=UPI0021A5B892|nr:helix-turn-helix transcriptional regulator [Ruegeria conchae]
MVTALSIVLRRHRQARKLSQEELAHLAGRSMRYISLLESCRHQPTLDTLQRISGALDLSLSQLVLEMEAEISNPKR